jgi:hypothetical protein
MHPVQQTPCKNTKESAQHLSNEPVMDMHSRDCNDAVLCCAVLWQGLVLNRQKPALVCASSNHVA